MSNWTTPLRHPELASDEVHVWRARLDLPEEHIQAFEQVLADDERARALRFRFQKDRTHFTAARGILRTLLGRYLVQPPARLQFRYNQYGKPLLGDSDEENALRFNVSHSHGMALFAFTCGRDVGVDIEYMLADRAEMSIARRFFSPYEVEALQAVPEKQRTAPGEPAALLNIREPGQRLEDWSLHDLAPGAGYAAALALKGEPCRVVRWEWSVSQL